MIWWLNIFELSFLILLLGVWFFDIRLAVSIIEFLSRRVQFQLKNKLIFYYFKFLKIIIIQLFGK